MATSGAGTESRRRTGTAPSERRTRGGQTDSRGAASWEREGGGPETYRTGRGWESERGYGGERDDERARSEAWRGDDWRRGDARYAGRNENMDWSQQARERGRHDAPYRAGEGSYGEPWRSEDRGPGMRQQERGRWTDDERQSTAFRRGHHDERRENWRAGDMPPRDWRDETYTGERGFEGGPSPWSVGEWSDRPGGSHRPAGRRDWDYERGAHTRDPREYRGASGSDYDERGWRGGGDYPREGWGDERRGWTGGQLWSEGPDRAWGPGEHGRGGGRDDYYADEQRGGWGREPRGEWHGEQRGYSPRRR